MGISFPHSPAIVSTVNRKIFVLGKLMTLWFVWFCQEKKLEHFIKRSQELSSLWLLEMVGKEVLSPDISLFHRLGNEIPIRLKIARLKKRVEAFWFIFQKEPQSQTRLSWVVFSPFSSCQRKCELLFYLQHLQRCDAWKPRQASLLSVAVLIPCHVHILLSVMHWRLSGRWGFEGVWMPGLETLWV